MTSNIDGLLYYASQLVGTKYEWWVGSSTLVTDNPFWAADNVNIDPDYVKTKTCNCAGLINLVKKKAGGSIPYAETKYIYAGGTWAWHNYLLGCSYLKEFNPLKIYPKGTLLLRQYSDVIDQGHLAMIYEPNESDPLKSLIIHSYSQEPYDESNRITEPGVIIEPLENSVVWADGNGYYHYISEPMHWLF